MSPHSVPDRGPANDNEVPETLDALQLRQEKELQELRALHSFEMQIRVDADPEHVADVDRDQTRECENLRLKHDGERKRYIREHEQTEKLIANVKSL